MQIIERNLKTCWKKYLPVSQRIQFCIKKKQKKQTKYNTADQVVDMQAVNFELMKHNLIFLVLNHNR